MALIGRLIADCFVGIDTISKLSYTSQVSGPGHPARALKFPGSPVGTTARLVAAHGGG
jgi:hypothetical protein